MAATRSRLYLELEFMCNISNNPYNLCIFLMRASGKHILVHFISGCPLSLQTNSACLSLSGSFHHLQQQPSAGARLDFRDFEIVPQSEGSSSMRKVHRARLALAPASK